jgi:hypothetical protein
MAAQRVFGEVLTVLPWCFFGVRSTHFNRVLKDTDLSTVVAGFVRSCNLQPRSWRAFLLSAWPARAREVTPCSGACGLRHDFRGAAGDFRWFDVYDGRLFWIGRSLEGRVCSTRRRWRRHFPMSVFCVVSVVGCFCVLFWQIAPCLY